MKEAGLTLPCDRDTYNVIDGVMNTEEVGIYITDFYTNKVLFVNDKMTFYASQTDITSIIGKNCRVNKKAGKNAGYCGMSTDANGLSGNPLDPHIREEYLEELDTWLKVIDQTVEWTKGRLIRIVTFYDITETQKMREQLTDFMLRDRLLGLKNDISMEHDIKKARVKPSLLLFEVSSMRKINEFYGWEIGDYMLCSVRDAILSREVANSELYRVGGEKFCLAINGIDRTEIKHLADEMAKLFTGAWKLEYEGTMMQTFNSVSVAVIHGEFIHEEESLLCMIERMLAKAKERKKVVIYNKKMDKAHKDRLKLEWDLKRCVHEDMRGFDLFYQPIVNSNDSVWCGLEALCRWNSPELGAVSPSVFIPEAERLELIGPLGLWVLETAVSKCKAWELDYCDNFVLNVNLSATQFRDEGLAKKIINVLKKHDFPGEKLCIEITESTSVTFLNQALQTIEQLREHHVLVALDDFGTGYSSFSRLKNMPVDIVKIERMFVADIEKDEYHRYLFHAMSDLAHAANMKLVAEGVERRRQMDILVKDGADYLQGYLFSKPLPPKDLEHELKHFHRQMPSVVHGKCFREVNDIEDEAI